MFKQASWLVHGGVALLFLAAVAPAAAQPDNVNFRFNSGQPVQPIYEGWQRNPDGTVSMYFGYINRNYAQELAVPVGSSNSFSPGAADRGQPTLFYTRIHRQLFGVKFPGNWGKTQELTWAVTANGTVLKAVGWMQPEWEIDAESGGQTLNEEARKNKAPTVAVETPATVSLSNRLTLSAKVADDGLPKPREKKAVMIGQESPPTLLPLPSDAEVPVNVPNTTEPGRVRRGSGPQGLTVSWLVWRGPAAAIFAPEGAAGVKNGQAVVTATFKQPGTYMLRAKANDGALSSDAKDVTVTVTP